MPGVGVGSALADMDGGWFVVQTESGTASANTIITKIDFISGVPPR